MHKLRLLRGMAAVLFLVALVGSLMPIAEVAASCTAPCAYDTYITGTANSGLVAYYPMYETSGTTMNDTGGGSHNGTYSASGLTLNGVSGVAFDGSANSMATTPSLDLTPANGGTGIVTVNVLIKDQETRTGGHMLFNQTANYGLHSGAIAFNLRNNAPNGVNRMMTGQSYDSTGNHYNAVEQAVLPNSNWTMLTIVFRRDQKYGFGSPLNDCYSGLLYENDQAQSPIVNQCWDVTGHSFLNDSFQFGAYGSHSWPAAVTMRGFGIWTRALTATEINDLEASASS